MDIPTPSHPSDRALRAATVIGWPFALILLIIHGAANYNVFPGLGMIPMSISSIIGLVAYCNRFKPLWLLTVFDIFLSLFLLGMLIPGWIVLSGKMAQNGWRRQELAVVGTYGTMPLMLNFAIHLYISLRELRRLLFRNQVKRCPHCHNDINFHPNRITLSNGNGNSNRVPFFTGGLAGITGIGHSRSSKEIYQPLRPDEYDDADAEMIRESSEIETTPRPSAETLRVSGEGSSKSVENLV